MEMDVALFEGMKTVPLTVHILFDKVVTPLGYILIEMACECQVMKQ